MARPSRDVELDGLVREHLPAALQFATRLCGDADRGEELVQEAFLRVARSWKSFRGESEFKTWLFRIVINAFRDSLRRADRAGTLSSDPADRGDSEPAAEAQARELSQLITERVSALPPAQRETLVLITYEGFSTREAAALLGKTEANVHAALRTARERLRKELASYMTAR